MKKFFLKILLFLIIILCSQALITHFFAPSLPEKIKLARDYTNEEIDILYFGDSVMRDHYVKDKDKRSLYEMLSDEFPAEKVKPLDHMAYGADIYLPYIKYITDSDNPPKLVVVPINLRQFSPEWDMRPQYQFEKEKLFFRYMDSPVYPFLPFLISFEAFDLEAVDVKTYESTPVFVGDKKVGLVKDFDNNSFREFSDENLKKKIQYHYMYDLKESHRKMRALVEIRKHLEKKGVPVVFYITPIDHETGEKYEGDVFHDQVLKNVGFIKKQLETENTKVLDLAFVLPHEDFNWSPYINEHLKEKGRKFVVERIAEHINTLNLLGGT